MRIIGGIYRSRKLRAAPGRSTRPTSDRVREALFSILDTAGAVAGACTLDLYAGTGALALEALSRGAKSALLVESSRATLPVLRANIRNLGLDQKAVVLAADVEANASRLADHGPFDLVFADPPWKLVDDGTTSRVLAEVARAGALSPGALVILEHAARSSTPEIAGLSLTDARRYGDTALAMYKPAILDPSRLGLARTTSE
jgi:16S rRNA (guanine966-N2)-methyltransferase